jgi:tRNA-splicing ligase RtcB
MRSYPNAAAARAACINRGDAQWLLPIEGRQPVTLIANDEIFVGFDDKVFEQIVNAAEMPGAERVVIGADAHVGFGICVGTTVVSETHVYPPVVGPDACCSLAFLQTDLPEDAIKDKTARRALINAITARIPTGLGNRQAPKARTLNLEVLVSVVCGGASGNNLRLLGIPEEWATKCERAVYGPSFARLSDRLHVITCERPELLPKLLALASLGAGNHFLSGDIVDLGRIAGTQGLPDEFGLRQGCFGSLSHCGSRGFGFQLMAYHERKLKAHFERWGIPFTGGDHHLICAPVDTPEARDYMLDLALAANFAVVNHLLIQTYVLEAVQEVFPGARGDLVYHISHNVGQQEVLDGRLKWVFRKGATRAFPANHPGLKGSIYERIGHPILLPGNARDGSLIMVARQGAKTASFSVNHGAGRSLGRKEAKRRLVQKEVDQNLLDSDVMHNGRTYPLDEAPGAYKDFDEVTRSVVAAGLATAVARLTPRFVIKDCDPSPEGAA